MIVLAMSFGILLGFNQKGVVGYNYTFHDRLLSIHMMMSIFWMVYLEGISITCFFRVIGVYTMLTMIGIGLVDLIDVYKEN